MTTILALFRGINVGGTRKLPMVDVRAACLALGWTNPRTYIQSGNLIVDVPAADETACALLEDRLAALLGWTPEIILCSPQTWRAHEAANPFAAETAADPRCVHLYLSRHVPSPEAAATLQARAAAGERAVIAGGALWIDYGAAGVARSRLTPAAIDRACGSPATGRNWNTVRRLREMLDARAGQAPSLRLDKAGPAPLR